MSKCTRDQVGHLHAMDVVRSCGSTGPSRGGGGTLEHPGATFWLPPILLPIHVSYVSYVLKIRHCMVLPCVCVLKSRPFQLQKPADRWRFFEGGLGAQARLKRNVVDFNACISHLGISASYSVFSVVSSALLGASK